MRSPIGWLTASSCALVLAACAGGNGASLPESYVRPAIDESERIGRLLEERHPCAARALAVRLQARTIDALNSGRIPAGLQEDLLGRVNLIVAFIPCGAMEPQPGRDPGDEARSLAEWLRAHS